MESSKGFFVAHMKAAGAPPNIALKSSLFPDRDVVGVVAALEPGRFDHHMGKIGHLRFPAMSLYGGFLKCWYPTTMGFPTKNDHHLGWRLGVPPFKETPIFFQLLLLNGKESRPLILITLIHFDVGKKTQQDVRPSHPSSKSLKAVTHMGRCHLKPPRMLELTAQLLRFCCWKKRGWVFSNEGSNPLSQDCQIKEVGTKLFQEQKQYQGSFYDIIPNFILFPVRSIKIPIRPHCLISPKWVPLNGSLDN